MPVLSLGRGEFDFVAPYVLSGILKICFFKSNLNVFLAARAVSSFSGADEVLQDRVLDRFFAGTVYQFTLRPTEVRGLSELRRTAHGIAPLPA